MNDAAADLNRLMNQALLLVTMVTPAAGALRIGWSGMWHMLGKEEDMEAVIRRVLVGMLFVFGAGAVVGVFKVLINGLLAVTR